MQPSTTSGKKVIERSQKSFVKYESKSGVPISTDTISMTKLLFWKVFFCKIVIKYAYINSLSMLYQSVNIIFR